MKHRQVVAGLVTPPEESTLFAVMGSNLSTSQRQALAEQFKASKQRLQTEVVS